MSDSKGVDSADVDVERKSPNPIAQMCNGIGACYKSFSKTRFGAGIDHEKGATFNLVFAHILFWAFAFDKVSCSREAGARGRPPGAQGRREWRRCSNAAGVSPVHRRTGRVAQGRPLRGPWRAQRATCGAPCTKCVYCGPMGPVWPP